MSVMQYRGVLPPIPTPFRDGEIDPAALRFNCERWIRTGLTGLVVLGSNGEAVLLDDDEADRVVEVARESVPRDRFFIVGTGREATRATIAAGRRAAALGADAVMVRTPGFFKEQMTSDAFVRHYLAVADGVPVPVLLYNFPAVTGVNLKPDAVASLSEHPNIVGVKESGGDVGQIAEYVACSRSGFAVLAGSAPSFYASLCVGAAGGVLALACVVPELCVRLWALAGEGRQAEALALQQQLVPLARSVTSRFGVPGLKAALDLAGYRGGEPRSPLAPAPPQAVEEIRRQLVVLEAVAAGTARH